MNTDGYALWWSMVVALVLQFFSGGDVCGQAGRDSGKLPSIAAACPTHSNEGTHRCHVRGGTSQE